MFGTWPELHLLVEAQWAKGFGTHLGTRILCKWIKSQLTWIFIAFGCTPTTSPVLLEVGTGCRGDRDENFNLQELCVHSFLRGEWAMAEKDCPSSAATAIVKLKACTRRWTELGDDVGV